MKRLSTKITYSKATVVQQILFVQYRYPKSNEKQSSSELPNTAKQLNALLRKIKHFMDTKVLLLGTINII